MSEHSAESDAGLVVAIYRQEVADGVAACTVIEHRAGPKRYARVWDDDPMRVDWGWTLHSSATRIFPSTSERGGSRE